MIHYTRVIQGLVAFIENELAAKLAGSWKAWLLRGMAGIAASRAEPIYRLLADKPIIKTLGLVDGENVNVDVIMAELRKQAQAGTATVDIAMIGPVTFGLPDVEALNRYVRG